MNVADAKLSRELYELSGWKSEEDPFTKGELASWSPHYDAGFLLRKLPKPIGLMSARKAHWSAAYLEYYGNANTAEDALCSLAIKLFKQNILTKGKHEGEAI